MAFLCGNVGLFCTENESYTKMAKTGLLNNTHKNTGVPVGIADVDSIGNEKF